MSKIIQGDSQKELKKLKSNSIETIITDPPYGLSFMGKKWDYDVPGIELWKECLRVLKPGGTALIFAGSRTQHRMAINIEDAGFELKDTIMWLYGSGFPKATDISKQLDKGNKRKIVHTKIRATHKKGISYEWAGGKDTGICHTTKPATKNAKLWHGWKSHGLNPAYEPIIVAVKPNDGSYANNALKYEVSGLNIDGARIETDEILSAEYGQPNGSGIYNWNIEKKKIKKTNKINTQGRFPANIILDEEASKMLDEQSGESKSGKYKGAGSKTGGIWQKSTGLPAGQEYGDKGGASRFFYCAKASKAEKNMGCENLEKKQKVFNGQSGNSSKEMKDVEERFTTKPAANNHPTVKPIKLMEYLCILTKTPWGGVVLDPFAGSGTTGVACEKTGRDFILIEREKEYIEIIQARLKTIQKKLF